MPTRGLNTRGLHLKSFGLKGRKKEKIGKDITDYYDKMYEHYPMVTEASVRMMLKTAASSISKFMRGKERGVRIQSRFSIVYGEMSWKGKFIISKVFGALHLYNIINKRRNKILYKRKRLAQQDEYKQKNRKG